MYFYFSSVNFQDLLCIKSIITASETKNETAVKKPIVTVYLHNCYL